MLARAEPDSVPLRPMHLREMNCIWSRRPGSAVCFQGRRDSLQQTDLLDMVSDGIVYDMGMEKEVNR